MSRQVCRVWTAGLLLALAAETALASVIYVNPGGSIQAAINAASPGDTIDVAAGSYDEALSINKAISLIGTGAGSTVLTYTGTPTVEQLIFLGTNSGSTINGSVTIDGFTLRDSSSINGDDDLIKFRANSSGGTITISNNRFDANGDTGSKGIEESQGGGNFVISNNEFLGTSYAVWLNQAHDGQILNNTLTGARIGMGGSGLSGDNPRDLLVQGNTIDGASYGLVLANNIDRVEFSWNDITNSTVAAVLYWEYGSYLGWNDVVFHNNNFEGNAAGFRGFSDPSSPLPRIVDGTGNWWGDASGPSGGAVDPITGATASGSGDSILLGNLRFDAWRDSPASLGQPPVADPDGPYRILVGEGLTLDASGSYDPDGGSILKYLWSVGAMSYDAGASAISNFTWPELGSLFGITGNGVYTVSLTVFDDEDPQESASASTTLTITPEPTTLALLGLGALALVRRRRRK